MRFASNSDDGNFEGKNSSKVHSLRTKVFLRVIIEEQDGHRSAWFENLPQIAIGGEWPGDAIRKLLEHFGEQNCDAKEVVAVEDGTRDGHLEFLMPLVGFHRIPSPSVN